jgi:CheY-like chemotaxis protein
MMPGIRGTQLIEAVRSEWPDLRVILATGYAEMPSERDDVPRLNKPFMQQDLARAIAFIARQQDEAGRVVQFRPR